MAHLAYFSQRASPNGGDCEFLLCRPQVVLDTPLVRSKDSLVQGFAPVNKYNHKEMVNVRQCAGVLLDDIGSFFGNA